MKNWLTIGQFSQKIGVSAKALRLYEQMGLLQSHSRGENGYRYYETNQLEFALRLKKFKDLGFSLNEIKSLLQADAQLNFETIISSLQERLQVITTQTENLEEQRKQIENIQTSFKTLSEPLEAQQKRVIMSFYGKVSIVITGHEGLEKTAQYTRQHFINAGQDIPILKWTEDFNVDQPKPYILIIKESELASSGIEKIHPDIIVLKGMEDFSPRTEANYLKLYSEVGPHMKTIINADDRTLISLVSHPQIRNTYYIYFSKNNDLKNQIEKIGGLICDGEEIDMYGFNNQKTHVHLKLKEIMTFSDEVALLSSFATVMNIGISEEHLKIDYAQ